MPFKNLDFLNCSSNKGQHHRNPYSLWKTYLGFIVKCSCKPHWKDWLWLKKFLIHLQKHKSLQILCACVCKASHSLLFRVTLLGFLWSEFWSQISSCFCLSFKRWLVQPTVPCSAAVFIPVLQLWNQKTVSLCAEVSAGNSSPINLDGDTRFSWRDFQTMYVTELYITCNQSSLNWVS